MFHCRIRASFQAAHRLLDYPGQCAFLHGHSYIVEVTVRGQELNELGILIDFKDLKQVVNEAAQHWDHQTVLNPCDPLSEALPSEHVAVMRDGNPTAENMARELFLRICQKLPDQVELVQVAVMETDGCWSAYSPV